MASKTKILGIALVIAAVTGLLIYLPLTLAGSRNDHRNEGTNHPMPMMMMHDKMPRFEHGDGFKRDLLRRFIANSTPVEIQGTVVALVKHLLVLNVTEGQVRIHLPPTWIVGEKVLETEDLFETDYLTIGQNITVKTLKGNLVTKETYGIYVLFGYEIINASDVHAYAVLRFNVETP